MKKYPVYFYGKEIYQWNPLKETLMEALEFQLKVHDISITDYDNLIVDFTPEYVVVTTKMAGHGG